jgi:hypothetical protein
MVCHCIYHYKYTVLNNLPSNIATLDALMPSLWTKSMLKICITFYSILLYPSKTQSEEGVRGREKGRQSGYVSWCGGGGSEANIKGHENRFLFSMLFLRTKAKDLWLKQPHCIPRIEILTCFYERQGPLNKTTLWRPLDRNTGEAIIDHDILYRQRNFTKEGAMNVPAYIKDLRIKPGGVPRNRTLTGEGAMNQYI